MKVFNYISILLAFSWLNIAYSQVSFTYPIALFPYNQGQPPANCSPIEQCNDGGYLLNYSASWWGSGTNWGQNSTVIIKTDANFVPIWKNSFNGFNGRKTLELPDGSLIFYSNTPYITGTSVYTRFSLNKFDALGNFIWRKSHYDNQENHINVTDVVKSVDGNILLSANQGYNSPALLEFDTNGNFLRKITFSNTALTHISSLLRDESSNDLYVTGIVNDGENNSAAVLKLNAQNEVLWAKKIEVANTSAYNDNSHYSNSLICNNGDLLTSFNLYSMGSLLCLFDATGNLIWSLKTSPIKGMTQVSPSEFLISSIDDQNFAQTFKVNLNGNLINLKNYGSCLAISAALQTDENEWSMATYGYLNSPYIQPGVITVNHSGDLSCLSMPSSNILLQPQEVFLTNFDIGTSIETEGLDVPISESGLDGYPQTYSDNCLLSTHETGKDCSVKIYPNPSKGKIFLSSSGTIEMIQIYNPAGQLVIDCTPMQSNFSLEIQNCGIYFAKVITNEGSKILKIIIE